MVLIAAACGDSHAANGAAEPAMEETGPTVMVAMGGVGSRGPTDAGRSPTGMAGAGDEPQLDASPHTPAPDDEDGGADAWPSRLEDASSNDSGAHSDGSATSSDPDEGSDDCLAAYLECTIVNANDLASCSDEAEACGLPPLDVDALDAAGACFEAVVDCSRQPADELQGCLSAAQADVCAGFSVADAAGFASGTVDLATEGVIEVLDTIGASLGLEPVTDAVSRVLGTVTPIVRCATAADYLQCIQAAPDRPGHCVEQLDACGLDSAGRDPLATTAQCAADLAQCGAITDACIDASRACRQFDPNALRGAISGITGQAVTDIFYALAPLTQCAGADDPAECQCALELDQCVTSGGNAVACVIEASACLVR